MQLGTKYDGFKGIEVLLSCNAVPAGTLGVLSKSPGTSSLLAELLHSRAASPESGAPELLSGLVGLLATTDAAASAGVEAELAGESGRQFRRELLSDRVTVDARGLADAALGLQTEAICSAAVVCKPREQTKGGRAPR